MIEILDWLVSRAEIDPDAFGCAVLIATMLVLMVAVALVYGFGCVLRAQYIKWRRKKAHKGAKIRRNKRNEA